jgi:hypothetical protein
MLFSVEDDDGCLFFPLYPPHQGENPFCILSRYGVFLLIAIFYAVANLNLKSVYDYIVDIVARLFLLYSVEFLKVINLAVV